MVRFLCVVGALVFFVDFALAIDLATGDVAQGTVTEFTASLGAAQIDYRFERGGKELAESHHYHFPETFFIPKFHAGAPIEIRASRHFAQMSAPRELVISEALFAAAGLLAALATLVIKRR